MDEIYGLDTTIATVDLNRPRHGKKIKEGLSGAEFCFDSVRGKIKVVIADASFFAYDNILLPLNYRIIPVIKVRSNIDVEKLKRKIESCPANLFWFDSRANDSILFA